MLAQDHPTRLSTGSTRGSDDERDERERGCERQGALRVPGVFQEGASLRGRQHEGVSSSVRCKLGRPCLHERCTTAEHVWGRFE